MKFPDTSKIIFNPLINPEPLQLDFKWKTKITKICFLIPRGLENLW